MEVYVKMFQGAVMAASEAYEWESAKNEWYIAACRHVHEKEGHCICGHQALNFMYTLKNRVNGQELFPVGSSCVGLLENDDENRTAAAYRTLFRLKPAALYNGYDSLKILFSRGLIDLMWRLGVFVPRDDNDFDAYEDYIFLREVFSQRKEPREGQKRKVKRLLELVVIPWLEANVIGKDGVDIRIIRDLEVENE